MASRPDLPVPETEPLPPATVARRDMAHRWIYQYARTLLQLQASRWTGSVRVYAEGASCAVHLRDGHPVFVEGGLPADSVGRVLARRGWISEAQLSAVVERRMAIQGRERFGSVALSLGILNEATLATALDEQVRDKVMRGLHWDHGELTLDGRDHAHPHRQGVPPSVEPLLLCGVRRHVRTPRALEVLAPFQAQPLRLRAARERVVQRFRLVTEDATWLDAALTAPALGELLERAGAARERAVSLLCALALADQLLAPETQAPAEPPPRRPASAAEAAPDNDQYQRHPEPLHAGPLRLVRPGPPPAARPYEPGDRGRDKLLADSAFLQGRDLLRVGEYAAAADAFKTAAVLRPGAREYALHAAWAGYRAGGGNERWRARLEAQCRGALSQDRHLAFAHHVLGQLALENGHPHEAQQAFSRALQLDPNDELSAEALARLT